MSTTQQHGTRAGALAAQELFESMFPMRHVTAPKVDTRTPADLGYRTSPSADERATWRKVAA